MPQKSSKAKRIAKTKNGVIRAKSEFFRTARYGLTLQEHRIIYFAILKGQQNKTPFEPVTISIREFKEVCELKSEKYYTEIRNLSKKLTGRVVEVAYKDSQGMHLLQAPWLIGITYHTQEGTVTIKPNKELQPFFEGKPFSETEFYFLIRFTSQYSERLYEIIKSLDHKKLIDFDVDDLRQRLAVTNGKYQNYADLKRFALNPAIKDINEFTDLDVSLHEKRGQYNKVVTVYFTVKKKKMLKLAERVEQGELRPPLSDAEQKILINALLGKEAEEAPAELEQLPGQQDFFGGEVEA